MKQSRGEADTGKCSRAAVPIQPLLAGAGAAPEPLQEVPGSPVSSSAPASACSPCAEPRGMARGPEH